MIKKTIVKIHDDGVIEEVQREAIVARLSEFVDQINKLKVEALKVEQDLADFDAQVGA